MSRIEDAIKKVFRDWGKKSSLDLKDEAEAALVRGGRKNPNTISLEFYEVLSTTPEGDVLLEIRAKRLGKKTQHWQAIEEGRKAGKKPPPSDVVGKKWQNEQGIDPRVVLLQIMAKQKRGLAVLPRKFKRIKKMLDYDKSAKTLSIITARSIGKKGIKPKPYLGKVLNNESIAELRASLTPLLGERFKLIIKGLERV